MYLKRAGYLAALVCAGVSPLAQATNGYFMHGYGVKSQGEAGAGLAHPQDALAAASNPAGTVWVGTRIDGDVTYFRPDRGSKIHGNQLDTYTQKAGPYADSLNHLFRSLGFDSLSLDPNASVNGNHRGNQITAFVLPEFAGTRQLGDPWGYGDLGVGLAIYGNGGMNSGYRRGHNNHFNGLFSPGSTGVEFQQLFVAPSIAWKITDKQSLGLKLNYVWQRFRAKGLGVFAAKAWSYGLFSAHPNELTDRDWATGNGLGIGLGYQGEILDGLSLGISWQSKVHMDKFDHYRGLFADGGNFDVPETYGVGLSWRATPALTLDFDVQEIKFGEITSVGQPFNGLQQFVIGQRLGTKDGPGFGWDNITVYKLGGSYQLTPTLIVRAGVSHTDGPISGSQTFFNTLAPATPTDHYSLGATWSPNAHSELSAEYTYVPGEDVKGKNSIPALLGARRGRHLYAPEHIRCGLRLQVLTASRAIFVLVRHLV